MIPTELQDIYEAYARKLAQAHKKSSIFAGLLGQGSMNDARNDPCNKAFYENVSAWVLGYAASVPEEQEVLAVCRFILEAARLSTGKPTHWYHLVAQAHIKPLIPLLSGESCRILLEQYLKWYPKRKQFPIQREISDLLAERV